MDTGIDGSRFFGGMRVDCAVAGHQGVDVSDAHQNADVAVWKLVGDLDLVEILRGVVVNRGPEQVAQVVDVSVRRRDRNVRLEGSDLLLNRRWEVRFKAVFDHDFASDRL